MDRVKILIKNITGDSFNEACLMELNRSGIKTRTVITGYHRPGTTAVEFNSPSGDDCVAWIGDTCEIVNTVSKDELKPGMEFFSGSDSDDHILILALNEKTVLVNSKTTDGKRQESEMDYAAIENNYYYFQSLPEEEFEKYLAC